MTVSIRASLTFGAVALASVCAAFVHPDQPKDANPTERHSIGAATHVDRAGAVDRQPAAPSPASAETPARAGPHPAHCKVEDNIEAGEPEQNQVELASGSAEPGSAHP